MLLWQILQLSVHTSASLNDRKITGTCVLSPNSGIGSITCRSAPVRRSQICPCHSQAMDTSCCLCKSQQRMALQPLPGLSACKPA